MCTSAGVPARSVTRYGDVGAIVRAGASARRGALAAVVSALAVLLSGRPAAGQVVFTERSAFEAALASFQTFSAGTFCPPTPPFCPSPVRLSTVGQLTVTEGALWAKAVFPVPPVFGFEPDAPVGDANFATFQSPTPLSAFGVDFGEPRYPAPLSQSTFVFTLDDGSTFTRTTLAAPPGAGGTLPLTFQFFGVISPIPFSAFTVRVGNPDGIGPLNSVAYDNVTVGLVPEPGTLALLGVGLAVLGVAFRRLVADASHEPGRPLAVIRAEAEIALTRRTRTESTAPGHAPTA